MVRAIMQRLACLFALAIGAAGCGSLVDDRPATFPYIQAAIITPTCAKAECHSSYAQTDGENYGTLADTRISLLNGGWVIPDVNLDSPQNSGLVTIMTHGITSTFTNTTIRMPYDEPMPAEDIKLIEDWIGTGDALLIGAPGCQCVPVNGQGCFNGNPVPCDVNGNVTSLTPVTMCSASQKCDARTATCVTP
jgi:hypothetical protein